MQIQSQVLRIEHLYPGKKKHRHIPHCHDHMLRLLKRRSENWKMIVKYNTSAHYAASQMIHLETKPICLYSKWWHCIRIISVLAPTVYTFQKFFVCFLIILFFQFNRSSSSFRIIIFLAFFKMQVFTQSVQCTHF